MKTLVSADSDEILGFTAIGPQAGEVMAVVQTAMLGKMPYTVLRDAIFGIRPWPKGSVHLIGEARREPGRPHYDGRPDKSGARKCRSE